MINISPSGRTANFRYAIRNAVKIAEARAQSGQAVTYLNIGDPQVFGWRPPRHIVEPVERALRDGFTGYTSSAGLFEAREAVASYATRFGTKTSPEDVIITSGASEAAELVLTALLDEGDELLIPAPGYPLYEAILHKLEAAPRFYRLSEKNGWQPKVDELRAAITTNTRGIVLINPNNPLGSITCDKVTREILKLAAAHNLLVISDEVYRELCFDQLPVSASVMAEEMGVPMVTLESLSKTHLIPGWRIGWMRFTNIEKLKELSLVIQRLASGRLCSPAPAQYAVKPALEGDRAFLDDFLKKLRRQRDFAIERVQEIPHLSCVKPAAAFYLMIKVKDPQERTDEAFVLDLLEEAGLLVVPGSGFGADPAAGYFRLVYLGDEELLGQVFQKIDWFLNGSRETSGTSAGAESLNRF